MHEFSLATQIVESILEFAEAHHAGKILKVRLQIGELTRVAAEQLRYCFNSIARETLLKNATLEIEPVHAEVRCSHCRYEGPPNYWDGALSATAIPTLQCPRCGRAAEPTRGHECAIKSVQFINPKPENATV